jgi:hypothetical protein
MERVWDIAIRRRNKDSTVYSTIDEWCKGRCLFPQLFFLFFSLFTVVSSTSHSFWYSVITCATTTFWTTTIPGRDFHWYPVIAVVMLWWWHGGTDRKTVKIRVKKQRPECDTLTLWFFWSLAYGNYLEISSSRVIDGDDPCAADCVIAFRWGVNYRQGLGPSYGPGGSSFSASVKVTRLQRPVLRTSSCVAKLPSY